VWTQLILSLKEPLRCLLFPFIGSLKSVVVCVWVHVCMRAFAHTHTHVCILGILSFCFPWRVVFAVGIIWKWDGGSSAGNSAMCEEKITGSISA